MSDRFFLDTNIFVYSFDETAPRKCDPARILIRRAIATGKGIISYQVAQEFFHVALRRFAKPLSAAEAKQYLSVILRPLLAAHSSVSLYGEALRLTARHSLSWYDALIVASAIDGRCGILYSEDLQHGQKFGDLQVQNPFL
jgi:predicted nucleic acid-binding protein